jgi:hypothetical protein
VRLPCLRQKNETTPSASTLDVVKVAPHMGALNELRRNPISESNPLGANAGITAGLPCLRQKMKLS